jgi:hypothetical protein
VGCDLRDGDAMGADGHWLLIRREAFHAAFPDVKPGDIAIYPVVVLGVEAYGMYYDTEGRDGDDYAKVELARQAEYLRARIERVRREGKDGDSYASPVRIVEADEMAKLTAIQNNPELPAHERNYEALNWFRSNAEDHEVWT